MAISRPNKKRDPQKNEQYEINRAFRFADKIVPIYMDILEMFLLILKSKKYEKAENDMHIELIIDKQNGLIDMNIELDYKKGNTASGGYVGKFIDGPAIHIKNNHLFCYVATVLITELIDQSFHAVNEEDTFTWIMDKYGNYQSQPPLVQIKAPELLQLEYFRKYFARLNEYYQRGIPKQMSLDSLVDSLGAHMRLSKNDIEGYHYVCQIAENIYKTFRPEFDTDAYNKAIIIKQKVKNQ